MMKRILLTALLMPLVCLAVWSNLDTAESDTYCGSHTDIEVDSSDKADIVYVKCDGDLEPDVWYGYDDDGDNEIEASEIEKLADGYNSCRLALDSDDYPHVVFFEPSDKDICYMYYDGSSWSSITDIATTNDVRAPDIAIGSDDDIHIVFTDFTEYDISYAHCDGLNWSYGDIDTTYWGGCVIACDGTTPVVAYSLAGGYLDTYYAEKPSSTWNKTLIDSNSCGALSIAVDEDGDNHIAGWRVISVGSTVGVVYHTDASGSWSTYTVDAQSYSGFPPVLPGHVTDIAIDSEGYPHIIFWKHSTDDVRHAWKQVRMGGWNKEDIETAYDCGDYASLAMDDDDDIFVLFWKQDNGSSTQYARFGFKSWTAPTHYEPEDPFTHPNEETLSTCAGVEGDSVNIVLESSSGVMSGEVVLSLYDIAGRRVDGLTDSIHAMGRISLSLSTSALPAGTYFYTVKVDDRTTEGAFILTR
jgi:hypothetical protein